MGAESYRYGKVYEWDAGGGEAGPQRPGVRRDVGGDVQGGSAPRHVPGWDPYDQDPMFSRQVPRDYQKLEGPGPTTRPTRLPSDLPAARGADSGR